MKLLEELGVRVSQLRHDKALSREKLGTKAHLSQRFLVEVEAGRGNIALSRLYDLSSALGVSLTDLVSSLPSAHLVQRKNVALTGLRGAGKTTIGKEVAARLEYPFVELDDLIEKAAGLTLQNIFEVHGEEYYGRLEREVLTEFFPDRKACVIATGGGIVTRDDTFKFLRTQCLTFWLKANAEDHWNRVLQQDPRPMTNYPNAMAQLQTLLKIREPLYARADFIIDTSTLGVGKSVLEVVDQIKAR